MTDIKNMKHLFDINFFNQLYFTQSISKLMIKEKYGSIINISSSAAEFGNVGRISYASSKAAINTSTKVMSRELANYNIRVNSIAPGLTNTDMLTKSTPVSILEETINNIKFKRIALPEEIANVALFLSSDLSSYITGRSNKSGRWSILVYNKFK